MRGTYIAIAAAALLAGCAGGRDHAGGGDRVAGAESFDEASGRYGDGATRAGEARDCVPLSRIQSTHVRGDQVIDFDMGGRETYRNILPSPCPQLGFEERFAYRTSISQLCAVDTVTVLQSPGLSRGATCGLGRFQPINAPAK